MLRIHIHVLRINILTLQVHFSRYFQFYFKVIYDEIVILTKVNHLTINTDLVAYNILNMNFS